MPETFEPITSQEQLDKIVAPLLEKERNAVKKQYADYDTLKSQLEARDTTIADRDSQIAVLQAEAAKIRIAHEEGLPFELARRLSGKDEDEMRSDAQSLKKFMAKPKAPPLYDPEPAPANTADAALKKMLGKLRKE